MADETLVPWATYAGDPGYAELPIEEKLGLFKEWHAATVAQVQQLGLVQNKEDEDYLNNYLTQAYDSVLDTQGTGELLGNAIQRSFLRTKQAALVAGLATGALDPRNEATLQLTQTNQELEKLPSSSLARKIGSDEVGIWQGLTEDKSKGALALGEFLLENLPAQVVTQLGAAAVGGAVAGPMGAAAAIVPTAGGSSLMLEYAGSVLEQLSKSGVDVNDPAQVSQAFQNEEFFKNVNAKALKKGIPPAVLDSASSLLAIRAGTKFANSLKATKGFTPTVALLGKTAVVETGTQAALGAGGEAGGQLLSEGTITSANQIALEGVLEAPGNIVGFATGFGRAGLNEVLNRVQSDPVSNLRARDLAEKLKESGTLQQADTLVSAGAPETARAFVQTQAKTDLESEIDAAQEKSIAQPTVPEPTPAEPVAQPEPVNKLDAQNTLEAAKVWGNIRARKAVSADEIERLGFMLPASWKLNAETGMFEFQGVPDEKQKGETPATPAVAPAAEPIPQAPAAEAQAVATAQAQQPKAPQQGQAAVAPALKPEELPAWEQVRKNQNQIRFLKSTFKKANEKLPEGQKIEAKAGWKRGDYLKNLEDMYGKIAGLEKPIENVPGMPETIDTANTEDKRKTRRKANIQKKLYNIRDSKLTGEQQTWKELAFGNIRRIAQEVSARFPNIPNVDDYIFDDLLRKTANFLSKNPTVADEQLTDENVSSILASWADDSAKDAAGSSEIQQLMKTSPMLEQVETSDRPAKTQTELDEEERAAGETRQLRAQAGNTEAPGTRLLNEGGYTPAREKLGPDQKLVLDWIVNKLTASATPSGIETKNLNSYEDLAKFLSTLNKKKTTAKAVSKMATEAREALAKELQNSGVGVTADQLSVAMTPEGEQARARARERSEREANAARERAERQTVADRGRNATANQYLAEKLVEAGMNSTPESRARIVSEVIEPMENGTLEDSLVEERLSNIQKGQPNEQTPAQPQPSQPVSGRRQRPGVRQQPGVLQPAGPGTTPARGTSDPVGTDQGQGQPAPTAGSRTRAGRRKSGVGGEQQDAPGNVPASVDVDPALESDNVPRNARKAVRELLDVLRSLNFPGKVRLGDAENPVYVRKGDRAGLTVYVSPDALARQRREILKKFGPEEGAKRWSQWRLMAVATHETVHNVHLKQLEKEAGELGLTFDQHLANEIKRVAKFLNKNRKLKKYVAYLYNGGTKFSDNQTQYFEFIRMLVENETMGRTTESATLSAQDIAQFMDDIDRRWLTNLIDTIIQSLSNLASRIVGTRGKDAEYLLNTAKLLRQLNRDLLNPPKKERVATNYVEPKQEFVANETEADKQAAQNELDSRSALSNQSKKFLEEYAKELGIKVPSFKQTYVAFNEKTRKHEERFAYRPAWKKDQYVQAIREKLAELGKKPKTAKTEDILGAAVPSDRPVWLKPDGQTVDVEEESIVGLDGLGNHSKAALEYLQENEPEAEFLGQWKMLDPFEKTEQSQRLVEEMIQRGWVRVAGDGFNIYFEGNPNQQQLDALFEAAIEDEARLVQDLTGIGGKARSKVVYEPPTSGVIGAAMPRRGYITTRKREVATARLPDGIEDLALVRNFDTGSHTVGLYEDTDGARYIVKTGQSREQFENEIAAENVYRVLGYPVADSKLIQVDGQPAKIAEYIEDGMTLREFREAFKNEPEEIKKVYDQLADGMLVDAFLFNYDSIGVNAQDNVLVRVAEVPTEDGEGSENVYTVYRIDSGGTFDTKAFEEAPRNEPFYYDSMRVMRQNYPYLELTPSDMIAQLSDLVLNSDQILNAVPQRLQGYMARRLQYMADQLSAVDILTPVTGLNDQQTELFFERLKAQLDAVQVTRDDRGRLINAATGLPSQVSGLDGEVVPKSEFRYRLERTPTFKAWFGDWENAPQARATSKILDEAGEPKLMYHGTGKYLQGYSDLYKDEVTSAVKTPSYIRRFGVNRFKGTWVADNRSWAEAWSTANNPEGEYHEQVVFPLYVKATKPFDPRDQASLDRLLSYLKEQGQILEPEDEYSLRNGLFDWQMFEGVFDKNIDDRGAREDNMLYPDPEELRNQGVGEEKIRKRFASTYPYRTLKAVVDLGFDGIWVQESLDKPQLYNKVRWAARGLVSDPQNQEYLADFRAAVAAYNDNARWNFLAFRRDGVKSAMNSGVFSSIKEPSELRRSTEARKLEAMVTVDGATGRNKLVYKGQTLYSTDSPAALAAYAVASPSALSRHNIAKIRLRNQPNTFFMQQRTAPSQTSTARYPVNDILGAAEVRPRRFGQKLSKVLSKTIMDTLKNKNYETLPDTVAMGQAEDYFKRNGLEKSAIDVLRDDSPVRAGVQEVLGMLVIKGYRERIKDDPEAAGRLASFVDEFLEKSTGTGRALRAYRFISMLGPEGLQAMYYKKAKKRDAVIRERFQDFIRQASSKLEPLSQDAVERALKEMESVLNKATKLARTNTRKIAAKTTMTLWQQFADQVGRGMTDKVNEQLAAMEQAETQEQGAEGEMVAQAISGAKPRTINQEASAALRKIRNMIDNLAREQGNQVKEADINANPDNLPASDEQIAELRAIRKKQNTIERMSDLLSLWPKAFQAWVQIKDTIRQEIAVNPKLAPLFESYLNTALEQPFTAPQIRNLMKASDIDMKELIRDHFRSGTLGKQSSDMAKLFMEQANLGSLGMRTEGELAQVQGMGGKEGNIDVEPTIAEKLESSLAKKIEDTVRAEATKILTNLIQNQADRRLEPSLTRFLDRLVKLTSYGLLDSNNIELWNQFSEQEGLTNPKLAEEIYNLAKEAESKPEGYQRNMAYQKAMRALYQGTEMDKWDFVMTWWYTSILSGWDTQGANALGNFSQSVIVLLPELAWAAAQGKGGKQHMSAVLRGMAAGWDDFFNIFKTGGSFTKQIALSLNDLKATDTGEVLAERGKGIGKAVGKFSVFVRRIMSGVDSFFYNANKEFYLYKYAYDQAYNDGKSGLTKKQAEARALEMVARDSNSFKSAGIEAEREGFEKGSRGYRLRVAEILDQRLGQNRTESGEVRTVDTQGLLNESVAAALNNTYQQEPRGFLGSVIQAINILAAKQPETRFVIPFTRIVGNVWNMSLDMSGYGLVRYYGLPTEKLINRRLGQWDSLQGSEKEMLRIRALLGLTFVGVAAALAAFGYDKDYEKAWFRINGSGPENPQAKQALMKTGWKPWSLKVGNRYWSYLPTPLAIPLALVGEMADNYHYKKAGARALFNVSHAGLTRALLVPFDMMFLSGLSDVFKMTDSSQPEQAEARAKAFVSRLGSSLLIPNLVKDIDQKLVPWLLDALGVETDWGKRTARAGMVDGIFIANTPVLRQMYGKPEVDVLGNPVEVTSRITTPRKPDPLVETLAMKNAFPSPARKELLLGLIPMDEDQFLQYRLDRSSMMNRMLNTPEMIQQLRESNSFVAQEIVKQVSAAATQSAKDLAIQRMVESNDPRIKKLETLGDWLENQKD